MRHPALIVFGPTASGKSALALELAQHFGGTIINADSMQVYRELRVLTARPTPEEEAAMPHVLYGVRPGAEPANAVWWREAALAEMAHARQAGRLPILCGGTGLYLSALTKGIAAIPDPGADAREEARALLVELGPEALHARLAEADPRTAARLRPSDAQRIARAWEVWRGTGRGLADWQQAGSAAPADWRFAAVALDPPRTVLREAIAARFQAMLRGGAIEEVRALYALGLDPALPIMRAHGVREIGGFLSGRITLEEAGGRVVLVTGQYAKRQATWLRHQELTVSGISFRLASRFDRQAQFSEQIEPAIRRFIRHAG